MNFFFIPRRHSVCVHFYWIFVIIYVFACSFPAETDNKIRSKRKKEKKGKEKINKDRTQNSKWCEIKKRSERKRKKKIITRMYEVSSIQTIGWLKRKKILFLFFFVNLFHISHSLNCEFKNSIKANERRKKKKYEIIYFLVSWWTRYNSMRV